MNKSELVSALASKTDVSKAEAAKNVEAFVDVVVDTLKKGDQIAITGFGSFYPKHREAREGRNPRTGEKVAIPAKTSAAFRPASVLKDI